MTPLPWILPKRKPNAVKNSRKKANSIVITAQKFSNIIRL
jgi:hypothetical protein